MPVSEFQIYRLLKCAPQEVCSLYRSGSRVYGCQNENSDEDFVAVVSKPGAVQDLIFEKGLNIIVQTRESFHESLKDHNMLSLECYFSPQRFHVKDSTIKWNLKLDVRLLRNQAIEKSRSDLMKSQKNWMEEPEASKKKLYHSIRVLRFALQIMTHRKIINYGESNELWEDLQTRGDTLESPRDLLELQYDLQERLLDLNRVS